MFITFFIIGRDGGGIDPQINFSGCKIFSGRIDARIKFLKPTLNMGDHHVFYVKANFTVVLIDRPFCFCADFSCFHVVFC